MRPRTVLAGCALLAVGIASYAVLSDGGLPRMQRQRADAEALRRDVAALEQQNQRLRGEVELLQGEAPGSEAYLEGVVREELGYIQRGEHLLILDEEEQRAAQAPAEAP